jgi:hypothetical protein
LPLSFESEVDGKYEKREEVKRRMEEQEALDKKLKSLQTLLVGDNVGLVSSVGEQGKASEPQACPLRRAHLLRGHAWMLIMSPAIFKVF